mmetsp:Transcript_35060/g.73996  ORF Transcript_35060/g.73996 Transcript_35060/m.73996 type:complete len:89 (+) Transcript_35060:728-994(+)
MKMWAAQSLANILNLSHKRHPQLICLKNEIKGIMISQDTTGRSEGVMALFMALLMALFHLSNCHPYVLPLCVLLCYCGEVEAIYAVEV